MVLIKRLLALEGDWVTIPGSIELAKIPKVSAVTRARAECIDEKSPTLSKYVKCVQGHCWVEGDCAEFSADSRNRFGPVCTCCPCFLRPAAVRFPSASACMSQNDSTRCNGAGTNSTDRRTGPVHCLAPIKSRASGLVCASRAAVGQKR